MQVPSPFRSMQGGGFRGPRPGGPAFAAAVLGWFVFPVVSNRRWNDSSLAASACAASNEPADVFVHWGPYLNKPWDVGLSCGPSRLYVIALGGAGDEEFGELLYERGLSPAPPTVEVRIDAGYAGRNLYFETGCLPVPSLATGLFGRGITGYGNGGFVLGAGSRRRGTYTYASGCAPDEVAVSPLPRGWRDYAVRLDAERQTP